MRLGNVTVHTRNTLEMQEESTKEGERKHTERHTRKGVGDSSRKAGAASWTTGIREEGRRS